jgi:DegV family protein with EDD domain
MRAQHRALSHLERRPVAVVTDTSADLPDAVLDRHHIAMVPLQIVFGDEVHLDRVGMRAEEFYRRLRSARQLPTTSQPTPADFVRVFRSALEEADEVVAVLLGSALSGTFQAAQAAIRAAGLTRIELVDSKAATLCLGLLALRAAELAESGWRAADIARELERTRRQSGVLLTVDTYDNLIRSGRVSRGKAWLAGMLDVRPILGLDQDGRIIPVDRVRGREALVSRMLALVDKNLTPRPKVVRFGVAHVEAPDVAERIRSALIAAFAPRDCFVSLATGVLGTHVGPGAFAICWQVEDGTPTRPSAGAPA